MKKLHKYLIIIGVSLLAVLFIAEKDIFIKRRYVTWNSEKPLVWNDFIGYPLILSKYGAAISSSFTCEFLNDSVNVIYAPTIMKSHHSWVLPHQKENGYALRHEQYHFNISEAIARTFRQALLSTSPNALNESYIKTLHKQFLYKLNIMQNWYDNQSDHSLILERQLDWEYLVDSMLVVSQYYANPYLHLNYTKSKQSSEFYNEIKVDAFNKIIGRHPVDSNIAKRSKCYKFTYDNGDLVCVEYRNRNKLERDPYFNVPIIRINKKDNAEEWIFYNSQNKPMADIKGVYKVLVEIRSNKIIKTYYDRNNNACESKYGVYKLIWELDYKGRRQVGKLYNKADRRIISKDGYYTIHYKYNSNNDIIEYANYDEKKNLLNTRNNIAIFAYTYDAYNNMTSVSSFNQDKKLVSHQDRVATAYYCYDTLGNICLEYFKDICDKVIVDGLGKAYHYYSYDKYSNCIDIRSYGLNKNLIMVISKN